MALWKRRDRPEPLREQHPLGLRSETETTEALRDVEARVGALEFRVDAIYTTAVEGKRA